MTLSEHERLAADAVRNTATIQPLALLTDLARNEERYVTGTNPSHGITRPDLRLVDEG